MVNGPYALLSYRATKVDRLYGAEKLTHPDLPAHQNSHALFHDLLAGLGPFELRVDVGGGGSGLEPPSSRSLPVLVPPLNQLSYSRELAGMQGLEPQ